MRNECDAGQAIEAAHCPLRYHTEQHSFDSLASRTRVTALLPVQDYHHTLQELIMCLHSMTRVSDSHSDSDSNSNSNNNGTDVNTI